ncbi:hypothetical protein KDL01_06995 [Actinospica durhamensis]|uniref:Uncharacterized protein n=1 Tax=Actinospica durhamensis TaxID=1508375 RepID=A0A941EM03_9ACTN|nr:hypothetical protein [Actinospica durhamensis]MBR7833002.1 hypothetical protein [Actinospica durhamensis]
MAEQLRTVHGFREGSKASWTDARSTGWPPFHYGRHRELDDVLVGTVNGLPTRAAGYELVFNGSLHLYGLALIMLPRPVDWLEVRGERPFSAPRVPDHVPDGQLTTGVPEFDTVWSVYAETADAQHAASAPALTQTMLAAPIRFSWRTHGSELLLWKRDGWTDAPQLLESISCVTNLLGVTEAYPQNLQG